MHRRLPKDAERRSEDRGADPRTRSSLLTRYESVDGGWGYYDFRVGTQAAGHRLDQLRQPPPCWWPCTRPRRSASTPPEKVVKRAIDSIHRQRKPDFSYLYGEYLKWQPDAPDQPPGRQPGPVAVPATSPCGCGATSRSPTRCCTTWLDRLFARNGWLDMGRKRPIPHESHFAVAGYFFYFGHYYAALCIEQLPAGRAAVLPGPPGHDPDAAAGEGRLVVGLSAVQLPPAVRHRLRADDAACVPAIPAERPGQ